MAKFLLTVHPVRVATHELKYEIEANSPEEAEKIFREAKPGAPMRLVYRARISTGASRKMIPVVIERVHVSGSTTTIDFRPVLQAEHPGD